MNENAKVIAEGAAQSLNNTQQNALNVTDLVRETGNLSDRLLHERYMQSIINSSMPASEKQKYLDHERRVNDRYVAKNVRRVERLQKSQTRNTNRVSWGWAGAAGAVILIGAAFTPRGRVVVSKAWKYLCAVPA
jgi:hypothetical protein